MAYNEELADRVRIALSELPRVEEKKMMGGLTFMVNNKMCVGILEDELMLRIDQEEYENALTKPGCRAMDFTAKPMKGFVFVSEAGYKSKKDFSGWLSLAVAYNKKAKPSKKTMKR